MIQIKPKILLSTYTYAPELNPRAYRWQALVNELSKKYEVHVVTRIGPRDEGDVKIFGYDSEVSKNQNLNIKTNSNLSLFNTAKQLIRKVLKKIIWPDFAVQWIPFGIIKIYQLARINKYELIISSSHPISGQIPLYILYKLKIIKNIDWYIDLSDPFGLIDFHGLNNNALFHKLNYIFEKDLCKMANKVFVTTKSTLNLYRTGYELPAEKIFIANPVISNVFVNYLFSNSSDRPLQIKDNFISKTKYNLIFAGTLYKKIRNPQMVLLLADYLESEYPKQFTIHFFTHLTDCKEYFQSIKNNVIVHDLVNQTELQQIITKCDAIINIGNKSIYQLPSKIVESVSSVKYIFNFVDDLENDTSVEFLKNYSGHANIGSKDDFKLAIEKFLEMTSKKDTLIHEAKEIVKLHLASEVVKNFEPNGFSNVSINK